MSHTPGPWTVAANTSSRCVVLAPRKLVNPAFRFGTGDELDCLALCYGAPEIRKANARLIASAPALLAACGSPNEINADLAIADALDQWAREGQRGYAVLARELRDRTYRRKAAIAQAEGR